MKVAIVDDDTLHLEFLVMLLARAGYDAVGFRAGRERAAPRPLFPNVFVPGLEGSELLRHIRSRLPGVRIVSVGGGQSSFATGEYSGRKPAHVAGADALLAKPVNPAALLREVAELVRRHGVAQNEMARGGVTVVPWTARPQAELGGEAES